MKNKTIYIFILSIVLLIGVVAFGLYIRINMIQKIHILQTEISKEKQLKNLEFGNLFKNNEKELFTNQKIIKNSFIAHDKELDFIKVLEQSAQNKNLKIVINKVQKGTDTILGSGQKIADIEFNVELRGSLDSTFMFINEVLSGSKKLNISEIKIYKSQTEKETEFKTQLIFKGLTVSYE